MNIIATVLTIAFLCMSVIVTATSAKAGPGSKAGSTISAGGGKSLSSTGLGSGR